VGLQAPLGVDCDLYGSEGQHVAGLERHVTTDLASVQEGPGGAAEILRPQTTTTDEHLHVATRRLAVGDHQTVARPTDLESVHDHEVQGSTAWLSYLDDGIAHRVLHLRVGAHAQARLTPRLYPARMTVVTDTADPISTSVPTRVLVFGMGRPDGTVLASDVYPVAEACGQSADQVRSCLRRLVSEGVFTRAGEGRDAVYTATESGRAMWSGSLDRHRLAYGQDRAGRGWDRRWHLVGFALPETRRTGRDAFRDRLLQLGGALVQSGLYVSTNPWDEVVQSAATLYEVGDGVTTATTDELVVGGERDPRVLAASLWDLDGVADRYERFLTAYDQVPDALADMRQRKERLTDPEFMAGALAAVVDFQSCFQVDPLLPPELLPRPWPGRAARELLAKIRKVGVLSREKHDRPALFHEFDEVLDQL
jgi:phenylacetic acid degradation operon negative regulatory protein